MIIVARLLTKQFSLRFLIIYHYITLEVDDYKLV